jgi:hypothetical protein
MAQKPSIVARASLSSLSPPVRHNYDLNVLPEMSVHGLPMLGDMSSERIRTVDLVMCSTEAKSPMNTSELLIDSSVDRALSVIDTRQLLMTTVSAATSSMSPTALSAIDTNQILMTTASEGKLSMRYLKQ